MDYRWEIWSLTPAPAPSLYIVSHCQLASLSFLCSKTPEEEKLKVVYEFLLISYGEKARIDYQDVYQSSYFCDLPVSAKEQSLYVSKILSNQSTNQLTWQPLFSRIMALLEAVIWKKHASFFKK